MRNFKLIIFAVLMFTGASVPAGAQQPAPSPPPTVLTAHQSSSKQLRR